MKMYWKVIALPAAAVIATALVSSNGDAEESVPGVGSAAELVSNASDQAVDTAANGITRLEYDGALAAYKACLEAAGFQTWIGPGARGLVEVSAAAPAGDSSAVSDAAFDRCSADWDAINAAYAAEVSPSANEQRAADRELNRCLRKSGTKLEDIGSNGAPTEAVQNCIQAHAEDGWRPLPGIIAEFDRRRAER